MENKNSNLQKQCPICGKVLAATVDYCPNCDSYVGDVALLQEQPVDHLTGESFATTAANYHLQDDPEFEQLDTIVNEEKKDQRKITLDQLKQLLSANGQKITSDKPLAMSTSNPRKSTESSTDLTGEQTNAVSESRSSSRRKPVLRRQHSRQSNFDSNIGETNEEINAFATGKESSFDSQRRVNEAEKIIVASPESNNLGNSTLTNARNAASKPKSKAPEPFYVKLGHFLLRSLTKPSQKVSQDLAASWGFIFGLEIVLIILSVQLIYNSGLQMSHRRINPQWGQAIIRGLTLGKNYTLFWPALTMLGIYTITLGGGLVIARFLVRENAFSFNRFLNQVARWTILLLPLTLLVFIYSLFNNPLVTRLSFTIIALIPALLVLAVVVYLIQASGNLICDRMYLVWGYSILALIINYSLLRPYAVSLISAFSSLNL